MGCSGLCSIPDAYLQCLLSLVGFHRLTQSLRLEKTSEILSPAPDQPLNAVQCCSWDTLTIQRGSSCCPWAKSSFVSQEKKALRSRAFIETAPCFSVNFCVRLLLSPAPLPEGAQVCRAVPAVPVPLAESFSFPPCGILSAALMVLGAAVSRITKFNSAE